MDISRYYFFNKYGTRHSFRCFVNPDNMIALPQVNQLNCPRSTSENPDSFLVDSVQGILNIIVNSRIPIIYIDTTGGPGHRKSKMNSGTDQFQVTLCIILKPADRMQSGSKQCIIDLRITGCCCAVHQANAEKQFYTLSCHHEPVQVFIYSHSHTSPSSGSFTFPMNRKLFLRRIFVEKLFSGKVLAVTRTEESVSRERSTSALQIRVPTPCFLNSSNVPYAISMDPLTGFPFMPAHPIRFSFSLA